MSEAQKQKNPYRSTMLYILVGLVAGVALTGVAVVTAMPKMMIVTQESRLGFDETVAALEQAIPAQGWVVSTVSDMNKSMAKQGVEFGPRVKLVKLCKRPTRLDVDAVYPRGLGRRRWKSISVEDEHALDGENVRR